MAGMGDSHVLCTRLPITRATPPYSFDFLAPLFFQDDVVLLDGAIGIPTRCDALVYRTCISTRLGIRLSIGLMMLAQLIHIKIIVFIRQLVR